MRKQVLLSSAAALVILSYGATAQTTNTSPGQTSGTTTAPSAQSTSPTSGPSSQTGTSATGQNSPSGSAATSTTPPPSGTTSQATTPSTSSSATTSGQTPAANATGAAAQPSTTTQNSGTAATTPAPANSGTAQRSNTQAPSGTAAQTGAQTPSTQQQSTQPNTNPGAQQAAQPSGAAQQNAQHNQAPGGVVSLNAQQRTEIGQTLARHNVKPVTNVNFSISVGTAVPRSVQLNALPADLVTIVPQYRGYSYFVVEEQIVIVEPSSVQIVAVIPYAGGTPTHATAPTKSRAVKLSTEEREVIRRHTSARRSDAPAPARKASRHYSVGDEVETTETIETFPETVYREAPSVRRYRYLRQDNSVILVDPDDHRVIDIFD